MKFTTATTFALIVVSSSSPANASEPLLRGAHTTTFEKQAAEATSTLIACKDPSCGGPKTEGEKCYLPAGLTCANGLYCIEYGTNTPNYNSGAAFCCPNGHCPNNQNGCDPNPVCNFGPPSPPTPPTPSPPTPSPPATPRPSFSPVPPGSWQQGCPGYWGGISHDGGDAYDFDKTPSTGKWACRPNNPESQRIEQINLDKFKRDGRTQDIEIDGSIITIEKTFGHSIDKEKQGCGQCWIIKPVAPQGQCGNFGTCMILKGNVPVILMMSVSEHKGSGHLPEIGNKAFKNGLAAFENDGDNLCNDLTDGKWSWEYQPYENADSRTRSDFIFIFRPATLEHLIQTQTGQF